MKRLLLKIVGIFIAVVLLLVLVVVGGVFGSAWFKLNGRFNNPIESFAAAGSPDRIARGQLLVSSNPGCVGCHSSNPTANPPLLDGNQMKDAEALGFIWAPNLTTGGKLLNYTDGELERAIREGISRDGRPLFIMPSSAYRHLSDDDVRDIIAWMRTQPSVTKADEPTRLSLLGNVLVGIGAIPLSNQQPVSNIRQPQSGRGVDRGQYLVNIGGCADCHGSALDGVQNSPGGPSGPTLATVKGWTEQQFIQTIRTGRTPSGKEMNPAEMPWQAYAKSPDDDLAAIYAYLSSRP